MSDRKPFLISVSNASTVDTSFLCEQVVELTFDGPDDAVLRAEVSLGDKGLFKLERVVPKGTTICVLARGRSLAQPSFGPWPSEEEIEAHYDKQEGRWLAKTEDGDVVLGYFEGRHYESLRFVSDGYHSRSDCASWTFCPVDRDGNKVARTTSP